MASLKFECLFLASVQKYNSFLFTDLVPYNLSIITHYSVFFNAVYRIFYIYNHVTSESFLSSFPKYTPFTSFSCLVLARFLSTKSTAVRAEVPVYSLSFVIKCDVSDSFSVNVFYEFEEIPHNS